MDKTQIKATYIDHCGSDLTTVNAARVSFGKESEWEWVESGESNTTGESYKRLSDKDIKLIKYLAEHKHYSPFGHAFASFHVKAPIFVARQLVKHKFLRWNEISRRYVEDEPEFYVPEVWRGKAQDKKQGSAGVVSDEGFWAFDSLSEAVSSFAGEDLTLYQALLKRGVAPEQARMVLPQSTMTEWYWSGSLDAFASMCALRLKDDTQYETRVVAQQVDEVMVKLFPHSWTALMEKPNDD